MNKLMAMNKKIEEVVVSSYETIETGVVSGYQAIEKRFVDAYLTPDKDLKTKSLENQEKE